MDSKTLKLMPSGQHWYLSPTKKDVWFPSVTFVTGYLPKGQFFERYLTEQESYEESKRVLQEAAERGTRCHKAAQILDEGGMIPYEGSGLFDEEYQLMSYYVEWHKKYTPKILHVELPLISDKHKLGGTADRIYQINGETVLLDIKTSRTAIYDSHWIQVAAYADMYEWLYKEKIDNVAILRLTLRRQTGYEYVLRPRPEWQKDYKQFKKTYDTMIYLQGGRKIEPKIISVPAELKL